MGERARKESCVSIRKVMGEVQLGIFGLHNFSHSTSVCVWFLLQLRNYPVQVGFFSSHMLCSIFFFYSPPYQPVMYGNSRLTAHHRKTSFEKLKTVFLRRRVR